MLAADEDYNEDYNGDYNEAKGREDYKYKAARSRHSLDARGRARSVSDGSQEMILPGFMML